MVKWVGPVSRTFRNIMLVIFGVIIAMVLLTMSNGSLEAPCCGASVSVVVLVFAYYVYHYRLAIVVDHVYSRWDMDKDVVCLRLDTAMRGRGVVANIDYWGDSVVFPLPPMSIVVRPGRKRTTVFVGPNTPETHAKAQALAAFVEAALRTGPRGG